MPQRFPSGFALGLLLLAACGGQEREVGIYRLEIVKESDTCTPQRAGPEVHTVGLSRRDNGDYFVSVPEFGEQSRLFLPMRGLPVPPRGPARWTQGMPDDVCVNTRREASLEKVGGSEPLEFRYQEQYLDVSGCQPGSQDIFFPTPSSDCEASFLLRYHLVETCDEGCGYSYLSDVSLSGTWDAVCDCSAGASEGGD